MESRTNNNSGDWSRRTAPSGFSLIEVLIAVLILALGLLGLGAIFPVVIREQRAGTDATTSLLAANAAQSYLTGQPATETDEETPEFWRELRNSLGRSPDGEGLGQWTVVEMPTGGSTDRATFPLGTGSNLWEIPLVERLYPSPDSGIDPQYVWDIAYGRAVDTRSLQAGAPDFDGVRVAVFMRRLDPRMNLPPGRSLRSSLLDRSIPRTDQRMPVAGLEDKTPTFDGLGDGFNYSELAVTPVQFVFDPSSGIYRFHDRLYRGVSEAGGPTPDPVIYWPLLAQVGQQFADNLGNVYTVVEVGAQGNNPWIRVNPPIPANVTEDRAAPNPGAFDDEELIRQAVFSPQIPAGVRVFTVPVEGAP